MTKEFYIKFRDEVNSFDKFLNDSAFSLLKNVHKTEDYNTYEKFKKSLTTYTNEMRQNCTYVEFLIDVQKYPDIFDGQYRFISYISDVVLQKCSPKVIFKVTENKTAGLTYTEPVAIN